MRWTGRGRGGGGADAETQYSGTYPTAGAGNLKTGGTAQLRSFSPGSKETLPRMGLPGWGPAPGGQALRKPGFEN